MDHNKGGTTMARTRSIAVLVTLLLCCSGSFATCGKVKVKREFLVNTPSIHLKSCGVKYCTPNQGTNLVVASPEIPRDAMDIWPTMYLRQQAGCGGVTATPWEPVDPGEEAGIGWCSVGWPEILEGDFDGDGDREIKVQCLFRNWRECVERYGMMEVKYTRWVWVNRSARNDPSDAYSPPAWNDDLRNGRPANPSRPKGTP